MAATPKPVKSFTPKKSSDTSISVSKVRVIVRVRPFLAHETSTRNGDPVSCISVLDRDSEFPQQEVAVYLKDPDTRFPKVCTFGFFCRWNLVLMMRVSNCFSFLSFTLAGMSATSWTLSLGKKMTMWDRYSAEKSAPWFRECSVDPMPRSLLMELLAVGRHTPCRCECDISGNLFFTLLQ